MDLAAIAQALIIAVLTAVMTTIFTAIVTGMIVFALQKDIEQRLNKDLERFKTDLQVQTFEHRSWWGLKREAYSKIIDALVELQYYLDRRLRDVYYESREMDAESSRKLEQTYSQTMENLAKACATGAFIVSEDTIATLEQLLRDLDRDTENWIETMHIHHKMVKDAVAEVRELARAELRRHYQSES